MKRSIAIAGAWGYIGRKVLDAALRRGWRVYVYDPGPSPADLDLRSVTQITDETAFYRLRADWFHLALHPEARQVAQACLLERARAEPLWILNEKPMLAPDESGKGPSLLETVDRSQAVMLYDFPELFDPLTRRVTGYLATFQHVELSSIVVERSKDREDPALPRNFKRMVPIQFQESVHCLAYVLYLLGTLSGSLDEALAAGLAVSASSEPYAPPNPKAYDCVVDGRCEFQLALGPVTVAGVTDFKRGARWTKRRVLRGRGDGRPFIIEADYLEGQKQLRINGVDQGWDAGACSYEGVLTTGSHWRATLPRAALLHGVYPNPSMAWLAYQLSGTLWRASHEGRRIELDGLPELQAFDSGYRAALPHLPRYTLSADRTT